MKSRKMKLTELVFDFDIYPRNQIDAQHVSYLAEAVRAGHELPPLTICKKSRRIVDGFHRARALARVLDKNADIQVVECTYPNEQALFLDAVRLNASHGRHLTSFDRSRVAIVGAKLKVDPKAMATALNMTIEKFEGLCVDRTARLTSSNEQIPIKRTIRHMAGKKLSSDQQAANKKLGGMNQMFYVNQLIELVENDLLEIDNEDLMKRIGRLVDLLNEIKIGAAQ